MTSMSTRNTMDTGVLESLFDRAAHLTADMITGSYTPVANGDKSLRISSYTNAATSTLGLAGLNTLPLCVNGSVTLLFVASAFAMATYAITGDRGREIRRHNHSPR